MNLLLNLFAQPRFTVALTSRLFLLLLLGSLTSLSAQTAGSPATSDELLAAYLRDPDSVDYGAVCKVLEEVRTVNLKYEAPSVSDDNRMLTQMANSIRANSVFSMTSRNEDGSRMPGRVIANFSKLYQYPATFKVTNWLKEMRKPMESGWTLLSVTVITPPAPEQKKHIYQLATNFIDKVYTRLEARKNDFPELRSLNPSVIKPGNSEDVPWPSFPSIDYKQADKFQRPGGKKAPEWCQMAIVFAPMAGENYVNDASGHRSFPKMACYADWSLRTANAKYTTTKYTEDPFLKFVDQSIRESLAELDAYEASLTKTQ